MKLTVKSLRRLVREASDAMFYVLHVDDMTLSGPMDMGQVDDARRSPDDMLLDEQNVKKFKELNSLLQEPSMRKLAMVILKP